MKKLLGLIADYFRETDKIMFLLCLVTTGFGALAVLSATRFTGSYRQFIVQILAALFGTTLAVFVSSFNYNEIIRRWYLVAAVGLIPVLLTFVIGLGPAGTDDKAWLDLGFTTFQPSELLKICFILTFSYHVSKVYTHINELKYLIPVCLHGAFPVLLIHFQGDDGTALIFGFTFLAMMAASGLKLRYFLIFFALIAIALPIIYFFIMSPEQQMRVLTVFNIEADLQGAGWQQWRGRIALAGGKFFGQGPFSGNLTGLGTAGIPEGYNDFIFVCIGEELGFVGCAAVILLLCAICRHSLKVAKSTADMAGKLICVGFFGIIASQSIINIGMCVSLLPVIGVTLPFFSAGGTSLACLYLGVGCVVNVYMHRNSRTIYLHD